MYITIYENKILAISGFLIYIVMLVKDQILPNAL